MVRDWRGVLRIRGVGKEVLVVRLRFLGRRVLLFSFLGYRELFVVVVIFV